MREHAAAPPAARPGPLTSRPIGWLVAVLPVYVLIAWAAGELFGSFTSSGIIGPLVGVTAVVWWQAFGTPARRRESEVTARALADHRDPGPQDRAAVDARATRLLAGPRADEWLPAVVLLGIAVACVVAAVVRDELSVAFPAAPLAVVAVAVTVWRGAGRRPPPAGWSPRRTSASGPDRGAGRRVGGRCAGCARPRPTTWSERRHATPRTPGHCASVAPPAPAVCASDHPCGVADRFAPAWRPPGQALPVTGL